MHTKHQSVLRFFFFTRGVRFLNFYIVYKSKKILMSRYLFLLRKEDRFLDSISFKLADENFYLLIQSEVTLVHNGIQQNLKTIKTTQHTHICTTGENGSWLR